MAVRLNKVAKEFGQQLLDNCKEALGKPPVYNNVTFPAVPYVAKAMSSPPRSLGKTFANSRPVWNVPTVNIQKVPADNYRTLAAEIRSRKFMTASSDLCTNLLPTCGHHLASVRLAIGDPPPILASTGHRHRIGHTQSNFTPPSETKVGTHLENSKNLTFEGKNTLLTGCGKGSIGAEISKGPLLGGAHIVVTASIIIDRCPKQGVDALINYTTVHSTLTSTMSFLDHVIPFVALQENGREVEDWMTVRARSLDHVN
ncbi:3-oxoacyl-[acyl-carrier-protein] synthase [Tulasnella sp. UAMH 9824]|nr:3-oxoacyl-[acyl-carrier-protein] synthase [Tulasnella sp. UAMH 9824]